jgi:DNA-3-methyladenine glycosylase
MEGIELMQLNRKTTALMNLCSGPAKLVQALGITKSLNGADLTTGPLTIHDVSNRNFQVASSSRVGIKEARDHQWRYFIQDNPFISKGKPS